MTDMAHEDDPMHDDKSLRARNVRTGLILAAIAVAMFVSFIVRTWYMGHG